MVSISIPGAIIASSVIGGGVAAYSSNKAANVQKAAAQQANDTQRDFFNQTQEFLSPYRDLGINAAGMAGGISNKLMDLTGAGPSGDPLTAYLTKPFTPDDLENTPGYKFLMDQGLKSTQNGYAARGLGSSGAALKGAARYAEGLADTTYQSAWQRDMDQRSSVYNMLMGQYGSAVQQEQIGANAAAGTGSAAMATGGQIAGNTIGAGNAQAAGQLATSNALGQIPSNALLSYMLMDQAGYGRVDEPNIDDIINKYAPRY